jgi:hypothetical protein
MPEPTVKEGRLPELHLPEVTREDIMRTFSEIRRPDIDLSSVEWPKVDLSRIEVTREDLDKAVLGIATAARIVRPAVRSRRLPLALGFLAVASLATFAILSRPAVRARLAEVAGEARRRAKAARGGPDLLEVEADVVPGPAAAEAVAIPIEPDAFNGSGPKGVTEAVEAASADPA